MLTWQPALTRDLEGTCLPLSPHLQHGVKIHTFEKTLNEKKYTSPWEELRVETPGRLGGSWERLRLPAMAAWPALSQHALSTACRLGLQKKSGAKAVHYVISVLLTGLLAKS